MDRVNTNNQGPHVSKTSLKIDWSITQTFDGQQNEKLRAKLITAVCRRRCHFQCIRHYLRQRKCRLSNNRNDCVAGHFIKLRRYPEIKALLADCDSQAEAKDHGDSSRPRSASLESCEGEKVIVKKLIFKCSMMTNDMTIEYEG